VTHIGLVPAAVRLSEEVAAALAAGSGVVALETTILTHGLPYPSSIVTARRLEQAVRAAGATPATIGVIDGRIHAGLDDDALERLCRGPADKIQARGLPLALARGRTGGMTVSATLHVASACGIRVFATGGIGGVHRDAERTGDISEDLLALARCPVGVVSSGAKAILDVPRTVEALETLGIPVVGFGTDQFPAFYHAHSGLPVPAVSTPEEVAAIARAAWHDLALGRAVLVCNPPPAACALPAADVERWIEEALTEARVRGISGAAITPHLLAALDRLSSGATVATNGRLAEANAALGGRLAQVLAPAMETSRNREPGTR
jgi:pseudouridylate synthase